MKNLPLHKLTNSPNQLIRVESIDYKNPYDYKKLHRHDYYEIILIENGGGRQVIDFVESELQSYSVYVVFPGQVHLLQRTQESRGWVLQFTQMALSDKTLPLFSLSSIIGNREVFEEIYIVFEQIQKSIQDSRDYAQPIAQHYLQILLWKVLQWQKSLEVLGEQNLNSIPDELKQLLREATKITFPS